MSKYLEDSKYPFVITLVNPELIEDGAWRSTKLPMPCSEEQLEEAKESIGIGEVDEFGDPYTLMVVTNVDIFVEGLDVDALVETTNLDELNVFAGAIDNLSAKDLKKFQIAASVLEPSLAELYGIAKHIDEFKIDSYKDMQLYGETEEDNIALAKAYVKRHGYPDDIYTFFDFEAYADVLKKSAKIRNEDFNPYWDIRGVPIEYLASDYEVVHDFIWMKYGMEIDNNKIPPTIYHKYFNFAELYDSIEESDTISLPNIGCFGDYGNDVVEVSSDSINVRELPDNELAEDVARLTGISIPEKVLSKEIGQSLDR